MNRQNFISTIGGLVAAISAPPIRGSILPEEESSDMFSGQQSQCELTQPMLEHFCCDLSDHGICFPSGLIPVHIGLMQHFRLLQQNNLTWTTILPDNQFVLGSFLHRIVIPNRFSHDGTHYKRLINGDLSWFSAPYEEVLIEDGKHIHAIIYKRVTMCEGYTICKQSL